MILESLLQLKRSSDHFKSWIYPKSFELIKVPEMCFPGGGAVSALYFMSSRVKRLCKYFARIGYEYLLNHILCACLLMAIFFGLNLRIIFKS